MKKDIIDKFLKFVDLAIKFVRKRFRLFYKMNLFVALMLSVVLLYFLVLVPMRPVSVPYLKERLTGYLGQNFDESVKIDDVLLSFSIDGRAELSLRGFFSQKIGDNVEIPRFEAHFSLLRLFLLDYVPSKVRIVDAKVKLLRENDVEVKSKADFGAYFKNFARFLFKMESEIGYVKFLELKNLLFSYDENSLLVDNFLFKFDIEGSILQARASGLAGINGGADFFVNSSCNADADLSVDCKIGVKKFRPEFLVDFCQNCADLAGVKGDFDLDFSFVIDKYLQKIDYEVNSLAGGFDLKRVFAEKMNYKELFLRGDYNFDLDRLHVAKVSAVLNDVDLEASYLLNGVNNADFKNSKLHLLLKNVAGDEVVDFWPLFLPKQNIRKWVADHVSNGVIKEAVLDLETMKNREEFKINHLDAKLRLAGVNVEYAKQFPAVLGIEGWLYFTPKDMRLDVEKAKVLGSEIGGSVVRIADFGESLFEIDLKMVGDAGDSLKHANYLSKKYLHKVEKYLNGEAVVEAKMRLPLAKKIDLRDFYLSLAMNVGGLDNIYAAGDFALDLEKKINSEDFSVKIDLAKLASKPNHLGVFKKVGDVGALKFILNSAQKGKVAIRNLLLTLKGQREKNLSLALDYDGKKEAFSYINLRNNLARNNYRLFYKGSKLRLSGLKADFSGIVSDLKFGNGGKGGLRLFVDLKRVYMANRKIFRDVKVNLYCSYGICRKGYARINYGKQVKLFDIFAMRDEKTKKYILKGNIFDVGYFAEALNLSKQLESGNAKVRIEQEKGSIYRGNLKIKDKLVIYESERMKKLAHNALYSRVKGKVFEGEKTVFGNVLLDFVYRDKVLEVESLVANNYKIGVTAKGQYNVADKSYDFKGLIIPGFIVNNLFGIGKIPIIGGVISNLLTGGEGGGVFGMKYSYVKKKGDKEAVFETNKISAFVPVSIRNLFDPL